MPAGAAAMFVGLFMIISAEQRTITAESGQSVTLTCRAPDYSFTGVNWSRFDLGDKYVLLKEDCHLDETNQHPSFKNRVDLQDRKMKDGDVSLILKDVTTDDAGSYECHIFMRETRSWKSICSIYLRVDPPGPTGGAVGLRVGQLLLCFLLLLLLLDF